MKASLWTLWLLAGYMKDVILSADIYTFLTKWWWNWKQFSHCKQPKQLQDGFCRKTLTAWGPRPFSKWLLGVAGSVVKTFIVLYRNLFISALARTTCMENITNRLPFCLQFANLSANMLPSSMQSEGGNVLENKTVTWKFLVQHPLCNRFYLATVKKNSSNHSLPGWGIYIFI